MTENTVLLAILDSLPSPVVFVDCQHFIRLVNTAGKAQYARFGDLTGKSIFECHNPDSQQKIQTLFQQLKSGGDELLYSENEKRRIYMRAVRDQSGQLLGYYERFEAKPASHEAPG
jgi:DUF438 domain-containing protein